jgi:outer membrane protein TolC
MTKKFTCIIWLILIGISSLAGIDDSLPFDSLIPGAMEKNPVVKRAKMDIKMSELDKMEFYFDYIPPINLSLSSSSMIQGARKVQLGGDIFLQEGKKYQSHLMGVSLSYYLVQWGEKRRNLNIQEMKVLKSRYEYISVYRVHLLQLIKDLLKLESLLFQTRLNEREIEDLNRQLELVEKKIESGSLSAVNGWKFSAEISNELNRTEHLKQEVLSLMRIIENNYGLETHTFDHINPVPVIDEVDFSLPDLLPAIETIQKNIDIAYKEMENIKRKTLPDIGISMGYFRSGTEIADVWSAWDENWNASVSVNLSLNLSNIFLNKTHIEKKQVLINQMQEDINSYYQEWNQWLEDLTRRFKQTQKDILMIQKNQKIYDKIFEYESKRYEQGLVSFENYIEIRRLIVQNKIDLHQSYLDYLELRYEYRINSGKYDPD